MTEKAFYNAYDYGNNLTHGKELKINHSISYRDSETALTEYQNLSMEQLQQLRESSVALEDGIFKKLCDSVSEWEEQAAKTMLIDRAIEYVKTHPAEHTANQWVQTEHGDHKISNAVYEMWYRIYDKTVYDRGQGKSIPVEWHVTWSVRTNAPRHLTQYPTKNMTIAGQDRKRFTDKAEMERYVAGRIKAYAHLFTEISPCIPHEYSRPFRVNGLLLPGYKLEGERTKSSTEPPPGGSKTARKKTKRRDTGAR